MSTDLRDLSGGHFRDASDEWFPNERADAADVAEAWVQFRAAKLVWRALAAGFTTREDIAALAGQSWESQRRKLAGEQPASLNDIARWVFAFDSDTSMGWLADSLLPPSYRRLVSGWEPGKGELPRFRSRLDWPSVAVGVAQKTALTLGRSTVSLLNDDVLLWLTSEEMTRAGMTSARLRVGSVPASGYLDSDSTSEPPLVSGIEYGAVGSSVQVMVGWFGPEAASDSGTAERAVRRAKRYLRQAALIAVRDRPATFLVAAPAVVGSMLLEALTGMSEGKARWQTRVDGGGQWRIGPFGADAVDDPSSDEAVEVARWWATHSCSLHALADTAVGDARVLVLGVSKPEYV